MDAILPRPRPTRLCLVVVIAAGLLLPRATTGQSLTGTLIASVRDQHGGAISGAAIRVSSPALIGGPAETNTSERGQFRFPVLSPGAYTVEITGWLQSLLRGECPDRSGRVAERRRRPCRR